ncbi:MAG TPA: hypothetical protein VET23_13035, partial [Chitinophagaceae bacterium]|nr:hypothetical protein [Chitinophagaceae bacterium]
MAGGCSDEPVELFIFILYQPFLMSLIKNKSAFILLLGAGHGLNDMIAGFFLGNLVQVKSDLLQISMGLFLYNLLAFGGQYPVALLIEKMLSPKKFLLLAYSMNVVAVASFAFSPRLSIVLAGIASAIYHVAGGSICARDNKAVNIGLFAAPGVAGLIAGGYFAYEKFAIDGWLLIASIIFLIMVSFCSFPGKKLSATPEEKTATGKKFHLEQHDLIMIMLLTFISLRSVIWDIFQLMHQNNYNWLLAIAGAGFVGKIAGGWLADKIGWRLYTLSSLFIATPLITFFKNELLLFCIGIGLLQ